MKVHTSFFTLLLISQTLHGWNYEDTEDSYQDKYNKNSQEVRSYLLDERTNDAFFENNNFKEIIRFDMIVFVDNEVDDNSKEILYDAIQKIKSYQNSNNEIRVTVIGHTNAVTEDENEKCVESGTYAKAICNLFTSCLTKADAKRKSKEYADYIAKVMYRSGILKDNTIVDYQSGKDLAYSDNTAKGRDLSNRVMITLYIKAKSKKVKTLYDEYDYYDNMPIKDEIPYKETLPLKTTTYKDNDFVETTYNYNDDFTLKNNDQDEDGVIDIKDKCERTPLGVLVDSKGCPYDSDKDGISDFQDKCADTPTNTTVDKYGCIAKNTHNTILPVHFKSGSARIEYESYPKLLKLSRYLHKYENYFIDIIGHTDNIGKSQDNLVLSKQRAKAIKNALIVEGIDARRIKAYGKGETEPIQSNNTQEGRDANRRIEIRVFH